MKKKVLLPLLLAGLLLITACTPAATPADPVAPVAPGQDPAPATGDAPAVGAGEIVGEEAPDEEAILAEEINISTDGTNLIAISPFSPAANTPATAHVFFMTHDRLLERDEATGELIYRLATSFETEDFQTYIFHLRQGVVFHDGSPFTANDVIATIDQAQASPGSPAFDAWRIVESATAIDSHTLEIVLNSVNVTFLNSITNPLVAIVSEGGIASGTEEGIWIGTGPFYLASFISNDHATMERFDGFWGDTPPTRRISLRHVPEMGARTMMMQNGETHIATSISTFDVPIFRGDPNFTVTEHVHNNPLITIFNMNDPIAGCPYFRRAFAHAVDRDDLGLASRGDLFLPVTDEVAWGFVTDFRAPEVGAPRIEPNLERVQYYLERSVWNGEEIEISAGIVTAIRMAEMMQEQLGLAGIPTRVNQMDPPGFTAAATYHDNTIQIGIHMMVTMRCASSMHSSFFPGAAVNRASYNNPEVTALMNQALTTIDASERAEIYRQIQQIVTEDMPYINNFWSVHTMITAEGVGGAIIAHDVRHDFRNIFMTIG